MLLTSVPVISSFGLLSVSDYSIAGFMARTATLRRPLVEASVVRSRCFTAKP